MGLLVVTSMASSGGGQVCQVAAGVGQFRIFAATAAQGQAVMFGQAAHSFQFEPALFDRQGQAGAGATPDEEC